MGWQGKDPILLNKEKFSLSYKKVTFIFLLYSLNFRIQKIKEYIDSATLIVK